MYCLEKVYIDFVPGIFFQLTISIFDLTNDLFGSNMLKEKLCEPN